MLNSAPQRNGQNFFRYLNLDGRALCLGFALSRSRFASGLHSQPLINLSTLLRLNRNIACHR